MVNEYYQKTKKTFRKKHARMHFFLKKKKTKSANMFEKDIKVLLKKKKKKDAILSRM